MSKPKIIIGIESSCDETSCAILQKDGKRVQILSNIVTSSAALQAKYGGVIPEQAAREQLKSIIPVIEEALEQAFLSVIPAKAGIHADSLWIPGQARNDIVEKIDAIAVTQGPGLIGSLLVGVETAKTLAILWNKPLIPVNHLIGHFYANWISDESTVYSLPSTAAEVGRRKSEDLPTFPSIGLLVSGGHTDLIIMKDHGVYEYIGGTRDDAAGECFDKCARLLGLPYPGGPEISKLAKDGNPKAFNLPRPMLGSKDFDFSFSGLKTAVVNIVHGSGFMVHGKNQTETSTNLAASIEEAIVDVLVKKTIAAAKTYNLSQIVVAGGVAANRNLTENLAREAKKNSFKLFIPPPSLCTDNAAMVTSAAFYNYQEIDPLKLQANPNLSLSTRQ